MNKLEMEPLNNYCDIENIDIPIIAGPCSAENIEQMISVADTLSKIPNVFAFRCGLWKPRTRPGGFQGVGKAAFPWIREIKKEFGLKVCVEVATSKHVEMCLKENLDFLWVGARTSGNPFSVEELCEAIKGTDIPIMIKNPIAPDLQLWIGAIERFYNAGCRKIIAIHRGFSLMDNDIYRNPPCWNILIEFKKVFPQIPVLCDPSHIAGNRDLLLDISLEALSVGVQGLMLEVHPDPSNALTDKNQQITPNRLSEMIKKIKYNKS